MDNVQLNAVRASYEEENFLRNKLQRLKDFRTNLTPKIDGTPHNQNFSSRIERLTAEIVDTEKEIENLILNRQELQFELFQMFQSNDKLKSAEFDVVIQRYIFCQPFKVICRKLNFSESRIFKLHKSALKKIKD